MSYVVYFDCSDLDPIVLETAKQHHQDIDGIGVTNDDFLCIEFEYYRLFERDLFLAFLNAQKSQTYYDRFEVVS